MQYRNLTDHEIILLEKQGCFANVWNQVFVKDGFDPSIIRNVTFIGTNHLAFSTIANKIEHQVGLFNCTVDNCIIEDQVLISNVGNIRNYIVRSHATITHSNTIETNEDATFGNGSEITVINEGGGREVLSYEQLTAPIAYMMAFMQHRPLFVTKLKALIVNRITQSTSDKGIIGHHANVKNCNTILNLKIGDHATIEGAQSLVNGTILSTQDAPSYLGQGVIANDFIASKGSSITDGVIIKHCFVGEGSSLQRQFSGENSLFFANSQLYHGEACSAFCAPYTVSHHKSTLLIAGYFSFINIGSGSNQSNHMYKLGPVHQGILERGCKLSSDSYILWPGKIGAFTFVMGRHYSNPDTSNFPFSYLLDTDGISHLVPGANFRSIGTIRDAKKWAGRDMRKGEKSDPIHLKLLSPFIITKVFNGLTQLKSFEAKMAPDASHFTLGDVRIKKAAVKRGIDIYQEILTIYYGDLFFDLNKTSINQIVEHINNLKADKDNDLVEPWHDLAGVIVAENRINDLIENVENGNFEKLSSVEKTITAWHTQFADDEWQWAINNSHRFIGFELKDGSPDELTHFLLQYKSKLTTFKQMLLKDAQKEYSETTKIGFGYDGNDSTKQSDFYNIRKTLTENDFVNQLQIEIEAKIKWVDSIG